MKKTFALAICAALLAGCTSSTTGTKEEQTVEEFNVVENDIDNNQFEDAFERMFSDTLSAYDYKVEIDLTSTGTKLDPEVIDGKLNLKLKEADETSETVMLIQDDVLYIIQDENDESMSITRYSSDGGKKITLALGSDASAKLESIGAASKDALSNEERETAILAGLFENSAKIPYSPVNNSDMFNFMNENTGTGLVVSIDIRDIPEMNEEAKKTGSEYLEIEGASLKDISIDMDYFDVLINNEGVIQQITNVVEITYETDTQKEKEAYDLTMNVYTYDYSSFDLDKINAIFDGIDAGTISIGDAVDISN